MSFYTSLSGLQAAQNEMGTISHNLANVSTNGFKKSTTVFSDVIASSISTDPRTMIGSGVVTKEVRQQFAQGSLNQSSSSLDLAIAGDGFFAVKPDSAASKVNFTRNGSFRVDSDNYVVDAQGSHLQVYPVDGSGQVVATGLDQTVSLKLPETSGAPLPTGKVGIAANVNANSPVKAGSFDRFDPDTYNQTTATTIYDADGNPQTLSTYYKRTSAPQGTPPTSTWEVHNFVGDPDLFPAGTSSAMTAKFDANGVMTTPSGPVTMEAFKPAGSTTPQSISINIDGSTQTSQPFSVGTRSQDGLAVGQLQGVTVEPDGIVRATFSNGENRALGKVALATFNNPTGLRQMGNNYWQTTGVSGDPEMGSASESGFGSLMSNMTEGSNVDITEELVGLIAAQRNFQANAKALDTASQISQTIFNIRT